MDEQWKWFSTSLPINAPHLQSICVREGKEHKAHQNSFYLITGLYGLSSFLSTPKMSFRRPFHTRNAVGIEACEDGDNKSLFLSFRQLLSQWLFVLSFRWVPNIHVHKIVYMLNYELLCVLICFKIKQGFNTFKKNSKTLCIGKSYQRVIFITSKQSVW